jgi:hypothetical protein
MAQERATISYADDTKRLRIGYSVLGNDGIRKEIWASFTAANYGGKVRERIARFEGPGQDAPTIKEDQVAWDTRVEELQNADPGKLSKSIYNVWKAHFGPATVDPATEKSNKRRRERAHGKHGSSKKPRMTTESPVPTTEHIDVTTLNDEQVVEMFYKYEQDMGTDGLDRMSKLLKAQFSSSTAPPVTMLDRMRNEAKEYAAETPGLIWGDAEFVAWKNGTVKTEEANEDEAQAVQPGIAYAELQVKIRKTLQLVEEYRRRWAAKTESK